MPSRKIGRPTESPKDYTLRVRLDKETAAKLEVCCRHRGLTKSEVVRDGIAIQYERLKK